MCDTPCGFGLTFVLSRGDAGRAPPHHAHAAPGTAPSDRLLIARIHRHAHIDIFMVSGKQKSGCTAAGDTIYYYDFTVAPIDHTHHASRRMTLRTRLSTRSVSGTNTSITCTTSAPSISPDPSASAVFITASRVTLTSSYRPKCRRSSSYMQERIDAISVSLNTRNPTAHTGSGQHSERGEALCGAGSTAASGTSCEQTRSKRYNQRRHGSMRSNDRVDTCV